MKGTLAVISAGVAEREAGVEEFLTRFVSVSSACRALRPCFGAMTADSYCGELVAEELRTWPSSRKPNSAQHGADNIPDTI